MRLELFIALALSACAVVEPPVAAPRVQRTIAAEPATHQAATEAAPSAAIAAGVTSAAPAAAPAAKAPRLTSVGYFSWIYGKPAVDDRFIGYVRFGQSVAIKSAAIAGGLGCSGGFYAIEPRGYVCRDRTVTLEPEPRFAAEAAAIAPTNGALPYRYALSNGAPMYARLPGDKAKRAEGVFGKAGAWIHLPRALASHEELAESGPIAADDEAPAFTLDGAPLLPERKDLVHDTIPLGSMLSFTRAFAASGRTWLLATDLTIVPADRVRPFKASTFRGTRLGEGGASLPIAWFKTFSRPKVKITSGVAKKTGSEWPARTFAELSGRAIEIGGERFLETKEIDGGEPLYVATRDATVVERAEKLPYLVKPGEKWIVVSLSSGTLVAYDGLEPFYATLVSPGKGGIPVKGQDPVKAGTTPLGAFRITFKDRAATMSPDKKGEERTLVISDVPFTQYFAPPFALHAAYWHDRFGEPTSAGCVNLAPIDAEALFDFTEPRVPEGWAGATGAGAPENGRASWVVIRR